MIHIDRTLITSHSDKTGAAPTYKCGFGFHPLLAFLDGTGEALAGVPRRGNAGSNTAADHVTVLTMALTQLPVDPTSVEVVARADSAGLTHGFIDACVNANVRFSVGHDLTEPVRTARLSIPPARDGRRSPRTAATTATTPTSPRSPEYSTSSCGPSSPG